MTQTFEPRTGYYEVIDRSGPAYQAYQILHFAFFIAPLVAGIDKFFHFLVNWDQYLAPQVSTFTNLPAHTFMLGAGAIEILVALIVAFAPRAGSVILAIWFAGIITNLLSIPGYFDIALRDFGLFLGAVAFARLSSLYGR